jgi:predicted small secreted protein
MRQSSAIGLALTLLVTAVLLSGCAGTARGIKSSVYRPDEALSVIDISKSQADAMVIIRYPAVVDEDALPAYYRAFEQHAIGGTLKRDNRVRQETDRVAQSIIAKSNYFAMSLYREFRDKLPEHSVLLSPHMITLDDEDRLTSQPLMNSEPLTFGDIVTPLFVVHSNRWLRAPTNGLLLSSQPLLASAWNQSERQADKQTLSRLEDRVFEFKRPLDFVSFLRRGHESAPGLPLKSAGQSRRGVAAVEVHPLEKIRMDGDVVSALTRDPSVDPFAEDFVKGAATRVVTALNDADHDRATFFTRQIALSRFDPALGEAFLSRSRSENLRARLAMGEALITAEKKFLSAQSESLYQGAYEGVYGNQMRQMLVAEYRMLEDRRDLARAQNLNTALAVVAMAGAVYAGSNNNSSNFFRSRTMQNVAMLTSIWAMNSAFSAHAQSRTVGENFLIQMAPAINRQVSVQVEWLESRKEITAGDFREFRNQTLSLYQSSVRSSSPHTFDPACQFRHPELEQSGRWFGLCFNGLGTSSGYGLILGDDGQVVEFVGTADSGLATGTGAMIRRSAGESGAVYYEGNFEQGLPDGVVKVEEPGRKPRIRQFRSGKDAGSADADRLQSLQF